MKKIIKMLPFIMIIGACSSGDEVGPEDKTESADAEKSGNVSLSIDGKSSELTINQCVGPRTDVYEGEELTTFSVLAASSNTKLSIYGNKEGEGEFKEENATYIIDVDGGALSGGITYSDNIPFTAFDGQKIDFKGATRPVSNKGTSDNELSLEFTLNCT